MNVRKLLFSRKRHPIYGVSWGKVESPVLTRTDAAVGMVANVGTGGQFARNDFDGASIYREMQSVTDTLGNVFVRIPKFYIKKTDGVGVKTWQVSKTKHDSNYYLPWCFWDFQNNRELPYVDFGKYTASLGAGNRLESKLGVSPLVNTNIVNMGAYAQNNNVNGLLGYQQLDIHVIDVLRTLMLIEFGTLNIQTVMQGYTTGRYGVESELATLTESATNRIVVSNATAANYRVGQTISVGTARYGTQVFYGRVITAITDYDASNKAIEFGGSPVSIATGNFLQNTGAVSGFSANIAATSGSIGDNTSGKYPCKYRGIESPFGGIWQFVDGVNINDHQAWVCKNADQYASNVFASPYEQLGYTNNATANNYVSEMGFDANHPFAEFPVGLSEGSATYYSDYYYQNTGASIALFGGYWFVGASVGISCWALSLSSSFTLVSIGGRLVRKPL